MSTSDPNARTIGWAFVAVQAVLLGGLVVLPGNDVWPTPTVVELIGAGFIIAGLVLVAVAGLGLGPALTPTPVPTEGGTLVTGGFYRFVRHPIYSGILAAVVGLTIRSASLLTLAVAAVTVVFFTVKARWEEARLAERYPGYPAYAAITGRFVPRLRSASPEAPVGRDR